MPAFERDPALQSAIEIAGGVRALTKFINAELTKMGEPTISEQAVSQWRRTPPDRVLLVEKATKDSTGRPRVTRHELHSKLYPMAA